ncbi:MAG: cytochrome c maturation protein CcmE [Chloroflexi bacterium]|nr:cytochrome c maturation protein CcmE [Chloroflexota bacterium]
MMSGPNSSDQYKSYDPDTPDVDPGEMPEILKPSSAASASTLISPSAKLILFGVLILAALGFFATMALRNASVYYVTVSELQAQGVSDDGTLVRVAGKLVGDSFFRHENSLDVEFAIRDEEGEVLNVAYSGEVGQLFFNDHSELILEGAYGHDGVFTTDQLIVKCPTKYVNVQENANSANNGELVDPDYDDPDVTTEIYNANS